MGKKKSRNKKNPAPVSASPGKAKLIGLVLAVVVFLTGVYVATKQPAADIQPVADATGVLIETRPVLSDALYTGKVAQAYRIAAEIPKVIDSQFCYCHCKKEHGHKTLLTCFTNKHGAKCEICINEVLYSYELYKKGYTLDEIVVAIDKKFYRPYKKHKTL